MSLDNIVESNLRFLKNLKEEDKCKVVDNKLVDDNDNFQDIQSTNIELVIINTLLISLHKECNNLFEKDLILNDIDLSIDKIYENKYIANLLDESDAFDEQLKNVDDILYRFKEKYQKNKCNRNFYNLFDTFNCFLKNVIIFSKRLHETNMIINGTNDHIEPELESASESESENDDVNDENIDNEGVEEKSVKND